MTLAIVKVWICNSCGRVSSENCPDGWTWYRSSINKRLEHRCPNCEKKAKPEDKGKPLGTL